jgi:hypothetical protein
MFVVRRFRIIAKSAYHLRYVRPSVHPLALFNSAPYSKDYREILYLEML